MRATVNLPDSVLRKARFLAAERGVSLSAVVEEALSGYFSSAAVASRVQPFRLHTVKGRIIQPQLDLDRTSMLVIAADEAKFVQRSWA